MSIFREILATPCQRQSGRGSPTPAGCTGSSTRPTGTISRRTQARSCGFGPHDRDDVGLWISLMPVSVDTDRLADELPRMLGQALRPDVRRGEHPPRSDPAPLRRQGRCAGGGRGRPSLADRRRRRGALRQQPTSRPRKATSGTRSSSRLLATLEITRDEELAIRQLTNEVLVHLQATTSREDFQLDEKGIRGDNRVVYPEQPPSRGPRGPGPSVRNHPAFRAEPGPIPWTRRWGRDLGRGARPPAPHLEAPQLRRYRCRRPGLRS